MFRRKPKPPLQLAIDKIEATLEIAYKYKRDKNFQPSTEDLTLFKILESTL